MRAIRVPSATQDLVALALSGAVELSVDEEIHVLGSGDAAYLRRGMSVVWRNRSSAHATLLLNQHHNPDRSDGRAVHGSQ